MSRLAYLSNNRCHDPSAVLTISHHGKPLRAMPSIAPLISSIYRSQRCRKVTAITQNRLSIIRIDIW